MKRFSSAAILSALTVFAAPWGAGDVVAANSAADTRPPAEAPAAPPPRGEDAHVDYAVICDDPVMVDRITRLVQAELRRYPELVVDTKLPARKLFIYAQRDMNDRMNPNGWSFSIAHVSNLGNQLLAARIRHCTAEACDEIRDLAFTMLREEGFLKHLNVAHIDELNETTLAEMVQTVFKTFAERAKGR